MLNSDGSSAFKNPNGGKDLIVTLASNCMEHLRETIRYFDETEDEITIFPVGDFVKKISKVVKGYGEDTNINRNV